MRIAFVTPEYVTEKYFSGGLANYLYRVAKALVSLRHEVHIIVQSEIDQSEFEHEGIQIHRLSLSKLHRRLNYFSQHYIPDTSKCLDFSFQVYRKLRKLHQQVPFDIIQFPDWDATGIVSSFLLPIPRVTRVSSYRPVWTDKSEALLNLDERILQWLEWLQMRRSRYIFTPSDLLKQLLQQKAKITNVQVIRTPCYLEVTNWDDSVFQAYFQERKYLLFFGRLQLHKGVHILIQALPQILEQYPDCYAAFVGIDSPSRFGSSMEEYAGSLCGQYADRLIFIDQLPHPQLYPVIAGAKLVVLPSLVDNFPNACLEAMALGKSVIGTLGASFDEIMTDGETGFLVPIGDVDALADKIRIAWTHPHLDEIGQAAQRKIQEFSIDRAVNDLLAYYEEILGKPPKRLDTVNYSRAIEP